MSDTTNRIKKITNRILAMPTAADTIPKNPKIPAIIAIIRNKIAAFTICLTCLLEYF
jgi:hypothetical protein